MASSKTLAVLALLLTMLIWGSAWVFMRSLALSMSAENSVALRYALIATINLAGLAMLGSWRIRREHWGRFLITGLIGMGGYNAFVSFGLALVPAGIGSTVSMTEPLMIAVLAWGLLGERLSPAIFLGIGLASVGTLVLFWDDLTAATATAISPRGFAYLLLACFCWSLYTILTRPLLQAYDSFTVTAATIVLATPLLVGLADDSLIDIAARLDNRQWLEVIWMVLASGILGTVLWNYGSKILSGAATASFLYLMPIVAVAGGALVLGEPVTLPVVAGGLLIVLGVAAVEFAPAGRRRPAE